MAALLGELDVVNRHDALNGVASKQRSSRIGFLHSAHCQVGLPRSPTTERTFERRNGRIRMLMTGGDSHPLPFGIIPRLLLMHLSTDAVRRKNAVITLGDSVRELLMTLGMSSTGGGRGGYAALQQQLTALAACRFEIDMQWDGRVERLEGRLLEHVSELDAAAASPDETRQVTAVLSGAYFESLMRHAVPVDLDALRSMRRSALSFDVYVWLVRRLSRVDDGEKLRLSWQNLRDQFGQEYGDPRNFKQAFRGAIRDARATYAEAKIEEINGGFVFTSEPLHRTSCSKGIRRPVDNWMDNSLDVRCGATPGCAARPPLSTLRNHPQPIYIR